MKCTVRKKNLAVVILFAFLLNMTACGNKLQYDMPYDTKAKSSAFNVVQGRDTNVLDPFSKDLCIATGDINTENITIETAYSAVLFDVKNSEVMYAKAPHEKLFPASITKVMTAIIALKNGSLDQLLTASNSGIIDEEGVTLAGIKPGDTMTLEQALHLLLISSANDVALMIAENIGGTVEHFLEMMNDEAKRLGATNTNFANPHGLTDPDHYTTAYDLYLIFNEAIKYDKFNEIIHMSEYQTIYYDKNGNEKKKTIKTTNRYLRGTVETPENVTIIGGKSGTTMAAGSCLIILSKDAKGSSYISVILHSKNIDELYKEMTTLLEEINK